MRAHVLLRWAVLLGLAAGAVAKPAVARAWGGVGPADSLRRALRASAPGPARVLTLLQLSKAYRANDTARAQHYAEWALARAQLLGNDTLQARSRVALALVLKKHPRHQTAAQDQLKLALAIFQRAKQWRRVAECYRDLGNLYSSQGNYPAALRAHQQDLALARQAGDTRREMMCYNNIGNEYSRQDQNVLAVRYLLQGLRLAEKLGDSLQIGLVAHNIAVNYQNVDMGQSWRYLKLALQADRAGRDTSRIAYTLANLGLLLAAAPPGAVPGSFAEAERYLAEASRLQQKAGQRLPAWQEPFLQQAWGNLAERRRRWPEAIARYRQAVAGYRGPDLLQPRISALLDLANSHHHNGDRKSVV